MTFPILCFRWWLALCLLGTAPLAFSASSVYPDWVLNSDGVLEDAECVTWSGSISIDKQQLLALGRKGIAARIGATVQSLDEIYQSKVESGQAAELKSSFKSSSKQVVDTAIQGTYLAKMEVVKNSDGHWLCGLVQMADAAAPRVAHNIVASSGGSIDSKTEEWLLEQLRSKAAPLQANKP